MEKFSVQKVFYFKKSNGTLSNHACVGLKESICLVAGHGVKFNFAYAYILEKEKK